MSGDDRVSFRIGRDGDQDVRGIVELRWRREMIIRHQGMVTIKYASGETGRQKRRGLIV
jgi:hypothetical protein